MVGGTNSLWQNGMALRSITASVPGRRVVTSRCRSLLSWSSSPALALVLALGAEAPAQEGVGYTRRINTAEEFERFSIPERSLPGVDRITKFLVPASDDPDLLPPLFQNVDVYKFHQEFLAAEFPDRFPGLGGDEYLELVTGETRSYFAGTIFRFDRRDGPEYGFDIFTPLLDADELPGPEDVASVFRRLTPVFALGALSYAPRDPEAIRRARDWEDTEFEIDFSFGDLGDVTYLPYTLATNFGRVRVFTPEEFLAANESGGFGSQDIVVLGQAPADIEGVIAGVITGSIQSELGHLAIRTARRGTPNAFVKDAVERFAPYDGKLVRLQVDVAGFEVDDQVTLAEAEEWWAAHRPDLGAPPAVDRDYRRLDAVDSVDPDGAVDPVTRYGGKGANFVRLFHLLPAEHRVPGLLVPFAYYVQFIEENRTPSRTDPGRLVSIREYIAAMLGDAEFRSDSRRRFVELARLRDIIEDGDVDAGVVRSIAVRIVSVFGTGTKKVRFRSSSNAEDQLEFNGAGLYRSVSGCAADDLDVGDGGPSRCDPSDPREDGVGRSLKAVWASLWNFRAYEERDFFQIPHGETAMAILVSEAFPDELANGVSFTGNPAVRGDRRFVVNAQVGDTPVVFTDPGVVAEKSVLEMAGGQVERIIRARASSLVPEGTLVLGDDHLRELGALMALVESRFPIDLGMHEPDEVLLDFEFKLDRTTERIRFKQVRPFLISDSGGGQPLDFRLVVASGTVACASFMESRPSRAVLDSKARVGLRAGETTVRPDGTSPADVFEWLELAPGGPRLAPLGPGVWRAERVENPEVGFRYSAHQDFRVGEQLARVAVRGLFVANEGAREIVLDPPALTWATGEHFLRLEYTFPADGADPVTTWILPCDLDHLPRVGIDVEFASGDRVRFEERFQEVTVGTGPAELVHARVTLGGETQEIDDYWRLVYTAGHHNNTPFPELWAILDPPIALAGVGWVKVVAVAQNQIGEEPTAALLGEDFSVLDRPAIVLFRRQLVGGEEVRLFRRGDADSSGRVNVADAVGILRHVFLGDSLACEDAADVDDIGTVNFGDAVLLLHYLFLGLDPPAAPGPARCGEDATPDDLRPCADAACR